MLYFTIKEKDGETMEIIFEILFGVYLELMMFAVPEGKFKSKKARVIVGTVMTISLLAIFALFIWGCYLVSARDSKLGVIPITAAIVLSIVQIIVGFALHK